MKAVGVIGLGAMGLPVAKNFLRAGYRVYGWDLRQDSLDALTAAGGSACASADELGEACDVVVLLVVDGAQIDAALFGESGAAQGLRPHAVVVSCATVPPAYTSGLATRLAALGIDLIDAPVTGGVTGAQNGTLTLLTSGPDTAYARCEDVLKAFSKKVYRFGDAPGQGSKMKVINQLLVCCHMAVAAEAMALGLREGVDPSVLYEMVTHGAGDSWIFQDRAQRVLAGDYTANTALDIPFKDIGLVLDTAKATSFPLVMAPAAYQMFARAHLCGYGKQDDAALIKIFPGIDLPQPPGAGDADESGEIPPVMYP